MASKQNSGGANTSAVTATVIPPTTQAADQSSTQFATLLAAIRQSETRLDQKLAGFRSDIREAQEEAATKAVNRVRHDKPYDFKKRAHEEQASFNEKVQEAVGEASEALETATDSPAVQRAKAVLQQGSALLAERQKLIKIADRSANGWSVVAEYTADELAADSDDEKRLEKAEKAAERKAGLRKRKRFPATQKSPATYRLRYAAAQPYGNLVTPYPAVQSHQQPMGGGRRPGLTAGPSTQRAVDPCFACGEMGHLRSYCPRMQSQEKKWYPFHELIYDCTSVRECEVLSSDVSVEGANWGSDGVGTRDKRPGPERLSHPTYSQVSQDTCDLDLDLDRLATEGVANGGDTVPDGGVVKGRLKRCIAFWENEIKAPATILRIIKHGYVLPLKSEPSAYSRMNHRSAVENSTFVHGSVSDLLASGCVVEVPALPHICSPLSVVEGNSGKKRLVINLRYLNRFLWKQRFI